MKNPRKNYKNNPKNNANYKLATEQYPDLNKDFYENYLNDYYLLKVTSLLKLLDLPDDEVENYTHLKIGKLEAQFDLDPKQKSIEKYVKTELVMTLYHCLETYIRLYMAHSKLSGCPNLTLSDIDLKTYRNGLKSIQKNEFNFMNNDYSSDELLTMVFYNGKSIPIEVCERTKLSQKEIINRHKRFLTYAADFILDNVEYNSFKHGMYVSPKESGFTFSSDKGDFGKSADALIFLGKKRENNGQMKWHKFRNWIDVKQYATLIIVFSLYINSLLKLWQTILVGDTNELKFLVPMSLDEILENKDDSGVFFRSNDTQEDFSDLAKAIDFGNIAVPLSYYK